MVRDLDLAIGGFIDGRRLEMFVDGLPLFGRAQQAVGTTLLSPLRCDGSVCRKGCWSSSGGGPPQDSGDVLRIGGISSRARLVVLAAELGGRWSEETMMS